MSQTIKTVYIVEDEPYIMDIYAEILSEEGIEVVCSHDGDEALENLENAATLPDVILLDVMMPKMSGVEFMEALSKEPKYKEIAVILLTNLPDQAVQERCYALGAVGTIMKSDIVPGDLKDAILAFLENPEKKTN